ncbi:L-threonylcarbamoyladenylate synthase [uncultured Arthrobacter sp.]|uniref:L-threonylcarbamoyladenylate synthase n=1 Tax=uncultured Arthrobacter sp. TaxID=114050 RepID=UPI0026175EA3|nr:L-threonylcarbamoyladenylate synthase [uncultured Arthrobacter sp.]
MSATFNCSDPTERSEGIARAQRALAAKQCVVIPTDTVYGIAADAFAPQAVATLLASKGRGRSMPPPVLIPRRQTMDGLATDISIEARRLAEEFWPGGLTLICHAQPSLTWDLGDTLGTVALRMPNDRVALDLLVLTGPLAVSSANRTGQPAAATGAEAYAQLGDAVEVYLEDGPRSADAGASTIVDTTGDLPVVVREGVISLEELRAVVPSVVLGSSNDDDNDDSSNDDAGATGESVEGESGGPAAAARDANPETSADGAGEPRPPQGSD